MTRIGPFRFPFIAPSRIRLALRPTLPLAHPYYASRYRAQQEYAALVMPARFRR